MICSCDLLWIANFSQIATSPTFKNEVTHAKCFLEPHFRTLLSRDFNYEEDKKEKIVDLTLLPSVRNYCIPKLTTNVKAPTHSPPPIIITKSTKHSTKGSSFAENEISTELEKESVEIEKSDPTNYGYDIVNGKNSTEADTLIIEKGDDVEMSKKKSADIKNDDVLPVKDDPNDAVKQTADNVIAKLFVIASHILLSHYLL